MTTRARAANTNTSVGISAVKLQLCKTAVSLINFVINNTTRRACVSKPTGEQQTSRGRNTTSVGEVLPERKLTENEKLRERAVITWHFS